MTDLSPDILATCSRWELDALRALGVSIPSGIRGQEVIAARPTEKDRSKKLQRLVAGSAVKDGRPKGSNGRRVYSEFGQVWPSIRCAAEAVGASESALRHTARDGFTIEGRFYSFVSVAAALERRRRRMGRAA